MSKTERREVVTTSVMKSTSAGQPVYLQHQHQQQQQQLQHQPGFDRSLDHLLEDLQSSVSRSGSNSMAMATSPSGAGPGVEIVPGEKRREHQHSESYSYSVTSDGVTGGGGGVGATSRLDTLLDDLKEARDPHPHHRGGGDVTLLATPPTRRHHLYNQDSSNHHHHHQQQQQVVREVRHLQEGPAGVSASSRTGGEAGEQQDLMLVNPAVLAQLEPGLLPAPNTKVTTTIKTYTYEIPGTPTSYHHNNQGQSQQQQYHSATTTSNNASYNQHNQLDREVVLSSPAPAPAPAPAEVVYGSNHSTPSRSFAYSSRLTTETTEGHGGGRAPSPGNRARSVSPAPPRHPDNHHHHQQQVHHTTYTTYSGDRTATDDGVMGTPHRPRPSPVPSRPLHQSPPHHGGDQDVNITYRYTSERNTADGYPRGGYGSPNDDARRPLLSAQPQPGPFPTGPGDAAPSGPPKRLDDLMAQFDRGTTTTTTVVNNSSVTNGGPAPPPGGSVYGRTVRQTTETTHRGAGPLVPSSPGDDVDRGDHRNNGRSNHHTGGNTTTLDNAAGSKNVAGPPVYYPPGHEMFARKEESMAYGSAQGASMRESGRYKYEAKSSSKTKSSSGMAVVPVCLPLCCGLPCVIM